MIALRKIFIFLVVIIFFVSENLPVYAGSVFALAPDYLCELGVKFYQRGRFADALHELRKALILKPDHETAKRYINLIEEELKPQAATAPAPIGEVAEKPALVVAPKEKPVVAEKAPTLVKAAPEIEKAPVTIAPKELTVAEKITPSVKEITPAEKTPVTEKAAPVIKAPPIVEKIHGKPTLVTAPEKPTPLIEAPPKPIPQDKTRIKAIERFLDKLEKKAPEEPALIGAPEEKQSLTEKKPPVVKAPPAAEAVVKKSLKKPATVEKAPVEKTAPVAKASPEAKKTPVLVAPEKPSLAEKPTPSVKEFTLVEKPAVVEKSAPVIKAPAGKTRAEVMQEILKEKEKISPIIKAAPEVKAPLLEKVKPEVPLEREKTVIAPITVEPLAIEKVTPPVEEISPVEKAAVERAPEKPSMGPPALKVLPPVKVVATVVEPVPPVKTRTQAMEKSLRKLEKAAPLVKAPPAVEKAHVLVVPEEKPLVLERVVPVVKAPPELKEVPVKETIPPEKPPVAEKVVPVIKAQPRAEKVSKQEVPLKEGVATEVIILDESIKTLKLPIEIEKGKSVIIRGKNVKRLLVTQPNALSAQRINQNEISVTGKDIGYTYLHAWDDNGRWTLEFLTTPPKPKGPTYEEVMRKEQEKAGNFKLRYSLGWSSFETGRRLNSLERTSFSYNHLLSLFGPIPYGDLDSYLSVRTLEETTDLTYFTLGLEKGKLNQFKDFSLRTFDYSPGVTNLSFSNPRLRGAVFKSPAFEKKIDYTVLWGREGGGRFGNLSPGIAKIKDSFISGMAANFSPKKRQNYSFSIFHGWGRDRPFDLNPFGYDVSVDYGFKDWGSGYELAYDSQKFAYLLNADFNLPKLKFTTEFRNTDKDFKTMTAGGWRRGEIGLLSTVAFRPSDKLTIGSRLDVFQDRLFPNPENIRRPNQDFDWDANYVIDPLTNLRLDYSLQNDLGRVAPLRSQNAGIGLYKTIEFVRRISTFVNYRHRESKFFTSHASDFINEKINLGLRFSLFPDLYYYLNKELNWAEERQAANHSRPHALETGIDWNSRLFKSPLYANLRFTYRDEEDTVAPLSFLAGEDYIEGFAELSYRPKPDMEAFCSTRIRNVWADNPNVRKRIDASFNAGMRYLLDTGVRWESKGNIEGYVFKDLNSDGLRQRDESPVEGIKLWLGKNKFQITDTFGYYKFKGIRAAKAYVTIDSSTLPAGFVLTVPATQHADIAHNQSVRLDFGLTSRSEITGFVFEDSDADGKYGKDDTGIKGAVLTLGNGKKAITDGTGKYTFAHLSAGEHTITLDLNSLPIYYLPQVAIAKKINLFEGVSYIHNIPLKRVENKTR